MSNKNYVKSFFPNADYRRTVGANKVYTIYSDGEKEILAIEKTLAKAWERAVKLIKYETNNQHPNTIPTRKGSFKSHDSLL